MAPGSPDARAISRPRCIQPSAPGPSFRWLSESPVFVAAITARRGCPLASASSWASMKWRIAGTKSLAWWAQTARKSSAQHPAAVAKPPLPAAKRSPHLACAATESRKLSK